MNFLWEGLNPIYLLPAIALVVYLHTVGLAANKKIGTAIPTILNGLLISMIISSPLLLLAHWGFIGDYRIAYTLTIFIVLIYSFVILAKERKKDLINKKIIILIIVGYISSLIFIEKRMTVVGDYWLYGEWFSEGSYFSVGSNPINKRYHYFFTILYRWMGSFSGVLSGASDQSLSGNYHFEWQVLGTFTWLSMVVQALFLFAKTKKMPILVPSIILSCLLTPLFSTSFYGSFSLFLIFLLIIEVNLKLVDYIIILLGFMLMVSSTIVMAPLIFSTWFLMKGKFALINEKALKITPLILMLSSTTIFFINSDYLEEANIIGFLDDNKDIYIAILCAMVISHYSKPIVKEIFLINSALSLCASLLLNYNWNLLVLDILPATIIHRYMNFIFVGEYYSNIIIILTLPYATSMVYKKTISRLD